MILAITATLLAAPATQDAGTFMKQVLDHDSLGFAGDGELELRLSIRSARGKISHRRLRILSAQIEGRQHSLVRFVAPAELAGTSMLLREEAGGGTTQLMYQPAYDKVRPIATGDRDESFMGTDFSYADLEQPELGAASYRFLADQRCGKATCRVVENIPNTREKETRGYGRVVLLVHPKAMVPMRSRFYALDGKTELKTLTVKKLKKIAGQWMVTKAVMKDLKKGSATQMELLKVDRAKRFPKAQFTEKALRSP